MNEQKAREILGERIQSDDGLRDHSEWVRWKPSDKQVQLDADFDADELEAIAWWMRNMGDKKS